MAEIPNETAYELCLMRHGIAVMRTGIAGLDDAKRPLTPDGRARMKAIARGLRAAGFVPSWIVTSPLVRAQQTAEIVAKVMGEAPLELCDALAPGGSPDAL